MKMKHKASLIVLQIILLFITGACEKEIKLNIGKEDRMLVVNSILCPDSLITVKVSYTQYILEDQPTTFINNAKVLIYENGLFLDSLILVANGKYQSKYKPETNKVYFLVVSDGIRKATATCQIPEKGFPVSPTTDTVRVLFGPPSQSIKMQFKDNGGQKNYYRFFLKGTYYSTPLAFGNNLGFMYNDEALNNETTALDALSNYINDTPQFYGRFDLIFSDKNINGTSREIVLSQIRLLEGYTIFIHQQTLSEDYYQYIYSYNNKPTDSYSEPFPIHSNIMNGVGIFGAYKEIVDTLRL